ncbi:MAG: hypothetical protein ACRDWI_01330 [Jiangellaceae bacterium]
MALGFQVAEEEPPPPGFASWDDFADRNQIPPELWRAAIVT